MKRTKQCLLLIFSFIIALLLLPKPVYASESNRMLEVSFSEFRFSIDDYRPEDVYVTYRTDGATEISTIRDRSTNETLEIITVTPEAPLSRASVPYTLTRSTVHANATIRLSISVELYNNGSFREVTSIAGCNLTIQNGESYLSLENPAAFAWGKNNILPTTEVFFSYNGTLLATVTSSMSGSVSATLLGLGFSASETIGTTTYYRYYFSQNGSISLY